MNCIVPKEYFDKNKVANIPIDLLSEEAPEYDRKWKKSKCTKRT